MAEMALGGELVQWNDARGFGFIQADSGERYFVHISAIGRIATRPRQGDRVSFLAKRGEDGRLQAASVRIAGANPLAERNGLQRGASADAENVRLDWRLVLLAIMLGLVGGGVALGRLPPFIALAYGGVGLVSFLSYWVDKRAAQARQWRTSEAMLLGLDFCFGILGGLAAQAVFRHKTRKTSYIAATVLIVMVHLSALLAVLGGMLDVGAWPLV